MNPCTLPASLLLLCSAAFAQTAAQTVTQTAAQTPIRTQTPYTFRSVAIVAGGFVTGIIPHPTVPGLMYLRTDIGGAYRWSASDGHWIPLTDWISAADSNLLGIESIALDPTDPNRVYLSAGAYDGERSPNGAVLASDDQGRTFRTIPMPFKMGGNQDGRFAGERLAVDPNSPATLFLGSRSDGLWKSTDHARTWSQVTSFPGRSTNRIGIVFVVFDPSSGTPGQPTPTLYAGVSSPEVGLFRSTDAGATWFPVPDAPLGLLPIHAALAAGTLYVTYGDHPGPNGMTGGAVWKLNTARHTWQNITPEIPGTPATEAAGGAPTFGYAGLAVDARNPRRLVVSTMDRWRAGGDNLYLSTDAGKHWKGVRDGAVIDASLSPYLAGPDGKTAFGHWIGSVALDPFHPGHALFGTGATVMATEDLAQASAGKPTHWTVGASGIEETAVISLLSPPTGPHLFSGLGDIGCFRDDDLTLSPAAGSLPSPSLSNCDSLALAALQPNLMARAGRVWHGPSHGGLSADGGLTWHTFPTEPPQAANGGTLALSANGATLLWATRRGVLASSTDAGATWQPLPNAPARPQFTADPVQPTRFYLYDPEKATLAQSDAPTPDFKPLPLTLPAQGRLFAAPSRPDDLWLATGKGLWHIDPTAKNPPSPLAGVEAAYALGFGQPITPDAYPTLFLSGKLAGQQGVFRSTDTGQTWSRVDDGQHHYGFIGVLTGDPRVFGRVYLGTNGRGVIEADPADLKADLKAALTR